MKTKLFVETTWVADVAIEEIEKEIHAKVIEVAVIENSKYPVLDAFIGDCKAMPLDAFRNFLADNGYIILKVKKDEIKDENF